jgi:outer membrane protein, multidrug efflux system
MKIKMMRVKSTRLAVIASLALMMQACAIPMINTKQADTKLPETYAQQGDTTQTASSDSVAKVDWHTFFDDANLQSLIEIAISNNKEVNILAQRISKAANEIQARQGEYKPFVTIGGGAEIEKSGRYTRNGAVEEQLDIKNGQAFPDPLGNYQFGLHASWELDVWKKLRNATKVATMEYMATVEGRNFLITNLVAEIGNAYYELIALDNQLVNLDQNIKIQQNALAVTKELKEYARATSLAVKRFEAEVKKNESKRYDIKQKQVALENRINFLLGRTPQSIARTTEGFMSLQPKVLDTGLPSQLLENRPDIRQAELALAAAKLNIAVAKANFYPKFSIGANLGFQAFNPKYLVNMPASIAYSIGGDIMAPLINRNAINAVYKNASASQIQAAYEYEQTIINAYAEVATQMANIDNLDKNYQLKKTQVDALNESTEVANQLFKAARAEYLEILLTQREVLEAKSELIETKQKQMSAMINLYRSLGGGWTPSTQFQQDEQKSIEQTQ